MPLRSLALALLLVFACSTAGAGGAADDPSIPRDDRPGPGACVHWLYQNGVKVSLGGKAWTFSREEASDMTVLGVTQDPSDKLGPLRAAISFKVTTGGSSYRVEGRIRYRKSEAYPGLLVYEEYTTTSVK